MSCISQARNTLSVNSQFGVEINQEEHMLSSQSTCWEIPRDMNQIDGKMLFLQ